jgi:hypothetical protein
MARNNRHSFFLVSLFLSVIIFLTPGCLTWQLRNAKKNYDQGKYAVLAKEKFECAEKDAGCNQLYLLKGDACYRCGDFACAAENLEKGIAMTKEWSFVKSADDPVRWRGNLCESLRRLRDLKSGNEAAQCNARLATVSFSLLNASSNDPTGLYYKCNARYYNLRACLINGPSCDSLCGVLTQISNEIGTAKAKIAANLKGAIDTLETVIADAKRMNSCK